MPVPVVGSATVATVWSELTSTVRLALEQARALGGLRLERVDGRDHRRRVTSSALTTTISMLPSLGKAAWMRS